MLEQKMYSTSTTDWDRDVTIRTTGYHEAAYALLRITFGMVFLFSGLSKIIAGIGNVAGQQVQQFEGKLPAVLVTAFFYILPFLEVAAGALLVLGLFNAVALILSGLLLAALTFGTVIKGDHATVAHNVSYAFMNSALLWLANYNGYSLDHLLRRGRRY